MDMIREHYLQCYHGKEENTRWFNRRELIDYLDCDCIEEEHTIVDGVDFVYYVYVYTRYSSHVFVLLDLEYTANGGANYKIDITVIDMIKREISEVRKETNYVY